MQDLTTSPSKLRVLNVGVGPKDGQAAAIDSLLERYTAAGYEIELETVDVNPELLPTHLWDITQPVPDPLVNAFDVIYCSHTLEHIPYGQVLATLQNLRKVLRLNGELWIIVPALEWAAKEIVLGREDGWLMGFLFGNQQNEWETHRSGFTLSALRGIITIAGLTIREAYQSWFGITLGYEGEETKVFNCRQNVVLATKFE